MAKYKCVHLRKPEDKPEFCETHECPDNGEIDMQLTPNVCIGKTIVDYKPTPIPDLIPCECLAKMFGESGLSITVGCEIKGPITIPYF